MATPDRREPTIGTLLGAMMLGLAEVLEGPKKDPIGIVEIVPGGDGDPFDLDLDPDHPERATVRIRHHRTP